MDVLDADVQEGVYEMRRTRWVHDEDACGEAWIHITPEGAWMRSLTYHPSFDYVTGSVDYRLTPAAQAYNLRCEYFAWRLSLWAEAVAAADAVIPDDEPF